VFNDRKASVVQPDRGTAFPSTRSTSVVRRSDSGPRFAAAAAHTSVEPAERAPSGDWLVMVIGVALGLVISVSGFAAVAHIWVTAGMIR